MFDQNSSGLTEKANTDKVNWSLQKSWWMLPRKTGFASWPII